MQQNIARSKRNTWLWWSGGKDCAWALHVLQTQGERNVCGLVTTCSKNDRRVIAHGTDRELIRQQANALQLPLIEMEIPDPCDNVTYQRAFDAILSKARAADAELMAFGDLHLADVRTFREALFRGSTLEPIFPLWKEPTRPLARRMVDAGLQAFVVCLDPTRLPEAFAGRPFDHRFLDDLPADVDACGENGEFHTLVHAGPMFASSLSLRTGDKRKQNGFAFTDILPDPEP